MKANTKSALTSTAWIIFSALMFLRFGALIGFLCAAVGWFVMMFLVWRWHKAELDKQEIK